jgi:tRNA C32,U32 (ribose-2'-O)-methylase TrmJ
MNLSQAAVICLYELFVASGTFEPPVEKAPRHRPSCASGCSGCGGTTLLRIGFMQEDKADHMMLGLRRILSRGTLTVDDVHILMGMARQSAWAAQNGRNENQPARR